MQEQSKNVKDLHHLKIRRCIAYSKIQLCSVPDASIRDSTDIKFNNQFLRR